MTTPGGGEPQDPRPSDAPPWGAPQADPRESARPPAEGGWTGGGTWAGGAGQQPGPPSYGGPWAGSQYGGPPSGSAPPAGYGPPGYGAAGYGPPPGWGPGPLQTETKAVVALVLAVGSFVVCPFVPAVIALVLASSSARTIAASGGRLTGTGLVKAARIVSWINLALCILGVLAFALLVAVAGEASFELDTQTGLPS